MRQVESHIRHTTHLRRRCRLGSAADEFGLLKIKFLA
jgi:hypothetical protein